ncbi:acyltransferase [Photobacterium aquae]|uniref:Acyltransferase n=1 Tax=Photobacterium aquae TaxID=1195763 RepID=A0A0J1JYY5_9GAMM|nr:acyltransferase family protein [Photobacterium aquae]KLV07447.1 acyltransferase [Photobacterium aquae]
MSHIKYRPDIDGLRAIAVIAVIIFHMNAQWLPGGFIGVDIFFVISGFIITSVIYPQINAGRFSFDIFYIKRIKRILPLFYLVATSSLALAYLIYTPNDFVGFANSLRYASVFISNIYFEKQSGYFAPAAETMPLLHTWSLSVEEQFYFIWPVLLILASKYLSRRLFAIVMGLTLVALTGLSQYMALNDPSAGYYLIQSRGFELLIGALLAIALYEKRARGLSLPTQAYQLLGVAGALGIALLSVVLNKNHVFPGINALWVTLATCMLILAGESQHSWVSRFLGRSPFLLLGRLSYSLYLWHWPVLAFYRYTFNQLGPVDALICAVITFALSVFSWRLYENPLRYLRLHHRWVYLFYLVLPIAIAVTTAKLIAKNEGYPHRFSEQVQKLFQASSLDFFELQHPQLDGEELKPFENNIIGDDSLNHPEQLRALVWGDSHGGHFRGFVDELGKIYGFSALYGGAGGCPPALGMDIIKHGEPEGECEDTNTQLAEALQNTKAKVVFLAGRWAMYTETTRSPGEKGDNVYLGDEISHSESKANNRRVLREGLERTVQYLIARGITPVIFEQAPDYPFMPSNCWVKKATFTAFTGTNCNIDSGAMTTRQGYANQLVRDIAAKYPQVILLPVVGALCDSKECQSMLNGVPLYSDNNHLNDAGAREIFKTMQARDLIDPRLQQLLHSIGTNR